MNDQKTPQGADDGVRPLGDLEDLPELGPDAAEIEPGADDPESAVVRERDELRERYQRALADQENARKRHQREMQDARRYGISELAKDLLEVADNLDRALDQGPAEGEAADGGLVAGVRMVRDELRRVLSQHGVEPIEAVGQPFDPMLHNAILQDERHDVAPGTVTEELVKGYRIADRLLRASMVKVSRAPASSGGAGEA